MEGETSGSPNHPLETPVIVTLAIDRQLTRIGHNVCIIAIDYRKRIYLCAMGQ